MPIAAIPAIIGAVGAVGGGVASMVGANKQANAANTAAQLQYQAQQNSLDFQKQVYYNQQAQQQPYVQSGYNALNQLNDLMSTPGQGLLQQYQGQFTAPTAEEAAATPGYQFALQQGLKGVEAGAAARGNLLTGGQQKALEQYGQGLASTTYQQSFNNALTQYQTAYNQFQQGQANTYNRLAAKAGTGQVAVNTLGSQGQAAAGNVANINLAGATGQGNALQNSAYQTASGYNALAGYGASALNNIYNQYQLSQLMNSQGAGQAGWGNLNVGSGGIPTIGTDYGYDYGVVP